MTDYWTAFQITICVEILVGAAVARWMMSGRAPWDAVCLAVLGVNLVTHPVAWYAIARLSGAWAIVEGLVVVVEFLLLRMVFPFRAWQAAVLAVATNGATLLLSLASGRGGF
jgi:hypothetical protein